MKLIGSASRDRVDHATHSPAVLNRVVRCVYLKLLDGRLRRRVARARAPTFFSEEGLIVVRAVEADIVLQRALTAEAQQAETI